MLKIKQCSSLEKIFSDEEPHCAAFDGCNALIGEKISFQTALWSDKAVCVLMDSRGSAAQYTQQYAVREMPSARPCGDASDDYYLRKEPGMFPDLLRPAGESIQLEAGKWTSVFFTFTCPADQAAAYVLSVVFVCGGDSVRADFRFAPVDAKCEPVRCFKCTHWFHSDCLAAYYNVSVFSEAYWEIVENYMRCYAAYGSNMILTPLFTPPLDTEVGGERLTVQLVGVTRDGDRYRFDFSKLDRWLDLCARCGIEYYELSHFFTQWGAKSAPKIMGTVDGEEIRLFGWETDAGGADYTSFLTQFAAVLNPYLQNRGLVDHCFVHISDEPDDENSADYGLHARLIKKLFPKIKTIDALSSLKFYRQGFVDVPIPSNNHIEAFIGHVPELWTYYCCGQSSDYVSNAFFAMPSQRIRVLGCQLWKFRCKGFLQWGFNFWNSQYSKQAIDPFQVTDAGAAFPSGDPFLVYPGEDGKPLLSLRLKIFYEAMQDFYALNLLESRIGYDAALAVLEDGIDPITFKSYPHSASWHLDMRRRVNERIAQCKN
ncbi:MAG: DUF4091 domain-containing protein [Oscillospiraceae bacterium]|jgi:hypothetical protein|nr:DUF4091 domain-containing protein [Oscillospiraceae bacterium]